MSCSYRMKIASIILKKISRPFQFSFSLLRFERSNKNFFHHRWFLGREFQKDIFQKKSTELFLRDIDP